MTTRETELFDEGILPSVRRPSRYIDRELHRGPGRRPGCYNVLLVFPDVYEIGMSHGGLRILHGRLAAMEGIGVEFAFAPWTDLEKLLRATGEPLRSWGSRTPVGEFDLVGITLQYELHYTNVLTILDRAGLALEAADRPDDAPLVVAGGPCSSNPLPLMPALDAVFLGDGEESLVEGVRRLADAKRAGKGGRAAGRELLAGVEGVFVEGITPRARARRFRGLDEARPAPIVPAAEVVHDRLGVEIMRGCTRGCRFCHAGVVYRPRRERSVERIVQEVTDGLDRSGWDEVSLLSLSTSDYRRLDELLDRLVPELERRRVSLALPSLRPETITPRLVAASSTVRRSGFTLAPEAGTERLRRVINKDMTDEAILEGCRRIVDAGWQVLKLYFMIGLPTETEEDLEGIAGIVERVLSLPGRRGRFRLNVSISPFVPKPHTPFQWERQCSREEFEEKERFLSSRIRDRRVQLSLRDPEVSVLEGIVARGDRTLWPALRRVWETGARFDSWKDRFRADLWFCAIEKAGLDPARFLSARDPEAPLPWGVFEQGVSDAHLRRERTRAVAGEPTADCRTGGCHGCDACRDEDDRLACEGRTEPAGAAPAVAPAPRRRLPAATDRNGEAPVFRYRVSYEKGGRIRFLSHRELINTIQRILRRTGLPISFTEGFRPRPRLSMGPPLPVGAEGLREFFDIELLEPAAVTPERFEGIMHDGLRVTACAGPVNRRRAKLPATVRFEWLVDLAPMARVAAALRAGEDSVSGAEAMWYHLGRSLRPGVETDDLPADVAGRVLATWEDLFSRHAAVTDRKGRERSTNGCAAARADGDRLRLIVHGTERGWLTPADLLGAAVPAWLVPLARVERTRMEYGFDAGFVDPVEAIQH